MLELSVASFNVHAGVDGWGRPFDVVDACRRLDADVLVLQETWIPSTGPGLADEVAAALGYRVTTVSMAPVVRYPVPDRAGDRWGPRRGWRAGVGMRIDLGEPRRARRRSVSERGAIGLALLERLSLGPSGTVDVLELGRMGSDPARRLALRTTVDGVAGSPGLVVAGTHLAHIRQGSPFQVGRLRRMLPAADVPAVLMGDMNMWGPPLTLLMPGWSRAVLGRSWPSWQPLLQIDHILVTKPVRVGGAEVVSITGSDHFPVRARLASA